MDKTMVTVAGLAAVGIGAVALYLYYNRSEDEAPGDEPVSVGPSPSPSPYALIPWKSGLFSTPTETLHVAVFLVRSYSTKPSTDIAQRAVYAIWCLKAKYTGDKQLEKWEKGGAVKKLYMNKTSEELDELYKRVQERGFGQSLIKNRCGQSTALATGPVTLANIAELTSHEPETNSPPLSVGADSTELKDSLELLKARISDQKTNDVQQGAKNDLRPESVK